MVTPVEKRDPNKYCEFHSDTGHSTDECMQLRKQIDEMIKAEKNCRNSSRNYTQNDSESTKKRGSVRKYKPIDYTDLIQPWERGVQARLPKASLQEDAMSFHPRGKRLTKGQDHRSGTVTLHSSRVIPMECAMISGPSIQALAVNQVLKEKTNIVIHPEYPEQTVAIGSTLTEKGRKGLCSLLKQNLDIFGWKPADMTGVPQNIVEHRLNIRERYSPVRQKKRGQAPERNKVIQEEVEKLVDAGIMKEVHYHSWLSNPVMVKKHDGTWRMCVDFKDLNNACPKDCYPLPEIDWKVESLCGYSFKCFLDARSIAMKI
ncbi:hypothetical protein Tco_0473900 [Tanacetum coccineum]